MLQIILSKPGLSKTLAVAQIRDAFSRATQPPAFQAMRFSPMHILPFQCSNTTTASAIEDRFRWAIAYQERTNERAAADQKESKRGEAKHSVPASTAAAPAG